MGERLALSAEGENIMTLRLHRVHRQGDEVKPHSACHRVTVERNVARELDPCVSYRAPS